MLTSRSGSPGSSATPPPQSIEAIRRRARHRLIGAAVLVLLGVLGFPMLFDTQPRPIAGDIPIEIPARNPAQPLASNQPSAQAKAPAAAETTSLADKDPSPAGNVTARESLDAREEVVNTAQESTPAQVKESPRVEAKVAPRPVAKAEVPAQTSDKAVEAVRSQALPEGKPEAAVLRLVVQVGAFAEVERAREARLKLERAGLKTYTHVAETPQGKRIRVRLGPFSTRAEADKAAARAKALGLPAAILTL